MSFRRKTSPGSPIVSIRELILHIDSAHWLHLNGKPIHPEVVHNMSLALLRMYIRRKMLSIAVRADDPDVAYTTASIDRIEGAKNARLEELQNG